MSVRLPFCFVLLASAQFALGQVGSLNATSQITTPINESNLVTLTGNTHPLAQPQYDQGPVADSLPLNHVYVQLQRSPAQQQALDAALEDLQNPQSPNYHDWLTADELGQKYGPSQQDIATVTGWLSSHGLQVNQVFKSGMTIDVSGTAGQMANTFHTAIHQYSINGQTHIANASAPQIPAALAAVVAGFNSLNDFKPKPAMVKPKSSFTFKCTGCPDGFDNQELYFEGPADFATIYNVAPLYKGAHAITGKGQTVVVLEDTDVLPADVATFRAAFGLSSYSGTFEQIHPGIGCTDPGRNGAEGEAALDSEWAGAVAPDAHVELASCADTTTNFGAFIAAQNLLNSNNPPPIMSLSYLGCEADQGPAGNLYIASLWEQAAIEGVSVFVAAGDNGAAGCDDFDTQSWAIGDIQANGLASTAFNVATGGTDFLDFVENETATYWSNSNGPGRKSAKSYIPETPWNDTCAGSVFYEYYGLPDGVTSCNYFGAFGIVAGSGAPSSVWAKPYWQKNIIGMPSDGARDLPDVSLFASNGWWNHAILFCFSDAAQGGTACDYTNPVDTLYNSAGGTSFTAPQFASIQALINQKAGAPQGNPNPIFYGLARSQYGTPSSPNSDGVAYCNATLGNQVSPACTFHDITEGNNDVPCYGTNNCYGGTGLSYGVLSTSDKHLDVAYPAKSVWDFATGLGSVNVTNLVNNWP